MRKFIAKPVVVEAYQYQGNLEAVRGTGLTDPSLSGGIDHIKGDVKCLIITSPRDGNETWVYPGDWVVRQNGLLHAVKAADFAALYDPAADDQATLFKWD